MDVKKGFRPFSIFVYYACAASRLLKWNGIVFENKIVIINFVFATLLSSEQSIFHDNGVGKLELKFINPDGREAVFNGDTLGLVTDPKYVGTYNYVNPAPVPDKWYDVGGWGAYAGKGLGHLVLDVVPYGVGGNVRGEN